MSLGTSSAIIALVPLTSLEGSSLTCSKILQSNLPLRREKIKVATCSSTVNCMEKASLLVLIEDAPTFGVFAQFMVCRR